MKPQNRTNHIRKSHVQPIPIPQVNRRHSNPLPSLFALVILLQLCDPELLHVSRTVLAKALADEEVGKVAARRKVRLRLVIYGAEFTCDEVAEGPCRVPAAEFATALGFVVHGCAEGYDTQDLRKE